MYDIFIGVIASILAMGIIYILFKVCKSIRKDLKRRKIDLIKGKILKVNNIDPATE